MWASTGRLWMYSSGLQMEVATPPTDSQGFITVWPPDTEAEESKLGNIGGSVGAIFVHQACCSPVELCHAVGGPGERSPHLILSEDLLHTSPSLWLIQPLVGI